MTTNRTAYRCSNRRTDACEPCSVQGGFCRFCGRDLPTHYRYTGRNSTATAYAAQFDKEEVTQ